MGGGGIHEVYRQGWERVSGQKHSIHYLKCTCGGGGGGGGVVCVCVWGGGGGY